MGAKPRPWRRADGQWVAQVSIGPRGARKLVRRYSGDRETATRLLEELLEQSAVASDRTTVGAYLRQWLDVTGAATLKASTLETYEIAVRRQLVPHLGAIELGRLAPDHVDAMVAELRAAGMSPKGIRNAIGVLGRILDVAERRGLVRRNVVRLVDPPRLRRTERHALTVAEARRIREHVAGDRLEALWLTTLTCGLRQAEVLGLSWADVDLDGATIRIRHVLDRRDGQYVLGEPKTRSSVGSIALPAFLVEVLRDHRRRQLAERAAAGVPTEEGLVFVSPAGRPLSAGWITHRWTKIAAELRLPLRFHDLRHGQASLLVALDVHPKLIAGRMRHATAAMSLDLYAHVPSSADVAVAGALQEALG